MSLKRALKALNLERPGDLLLLGVPTEDEKLIEKLTGAKIKTKDQKEKMKNIFKAFDVDLFYQLGVNFNVVWSNRTPNLAEGSFEELKGLSTVTVVVPASLQSVTYFPCVVS